MGAEFNPPEMKVVYETNGALFIISGGLKILREGETRDVTFAKGVEKAKICNEGSIPTFLQPLVDKIQEGIDAVAAQAMAPRVNG